MEEGGGHVIVDCINRVKQSGAMFIFWTMMVNLFVFLGN